uniref:Uncharacterized protein n=1 Tax=Sinocyclocheilus rhinocerous TaxID=307959 RepID=A0A673M8J7_9TELE
LPSMLSLMHTKVCSLTHHTVLYIHISESCLTKLSCSLCHRSICVYVCEMAKARISVAEDQFILTIPCGHSYCMSCITGHWNHEDQRGIYSCPQCRKSFTPRPDLGKNVMIAEMVEKCDVCTGRKNKAVKSCLVCLNSYCQTHFEEFHSDKRHKVIDATGRLKQMICQKHDKILEVFCCTDQQFICVVCTLDEHRNHETVSAAEEMTKMQAAVEDSEKIFSDLIRTIERSRSEVTKLIRAQERASVSRAEERLEQLKQEITDLRRSEAELKQLSDTDDHIHLLQVTESNLGHGSHYYELCCSEVILQIGEFSFLGEVFLFYLLFVCVEFPVSLSLWIYKITQNHHQTITSTHTDQPYPDHPDRFVSVVQVLCRESVSGRCYWEVDYGQSERLGVSVSYKSISRKGRGNECKFGHNNQSWILLCSPPKYIFLHNNIKTKLIVASSSSRIGVYVDHRAGILSFYSVSDTITLIHKVQTTFTQPLYPGFSLGSNATVKLCNVKT